jgi:hypothetical protein
MSRSSRLLTSAASIRSRHEPPTANFRSPFIPHPLPYAQPPFPPSSRAVTPLYTVFAPNRPLTPLPTAFTQTHRCVGYPCVYLRQSRVTIHDFVRPLFSYFYELLFPQALYFDNHPHCPPVSPPSILTEACLRLCALGVSAVSYAFSFSCTLFISLAPLFSTPALCFQSFAHSLTKTPRGMGVCMRRPL